VCSNAKQLVTELAVISKRENNIYLIVTNPDDTSKKLYVPENTVTKYILNKLKRLKLNDQSFEGANHYLDNVMSLNMSDSKLQDTIEARNNVQKFANRSQTCVIIFTLFELCDEWFRRTVYKSFTTVYHAETSEPK